MPSWETYFIILNAVHGTHSRGSKRGLYHKCLRQDVRPGPQSIVSLNEVEQVT